MKRAILRIAFFTMAFFLSDFFMHNVATQTQQLNHNPYSQNMLPFLETANANDNTTSKNIPTQKLHIVATSFHEYDWLRQIIGTEQDYITLTLLIDNGVDLHSFEPSIADIAQISTADLFVYNGGLSESWVKDIVAHANEERAKKSEHALQTFIVMEHLGNKVKSEVMTEGMQEGAHAHKHTHNTQQAQQEQQAQHVQRARHEHDSHADHEYHEHHDKQHSHCTDPSHNHNEHHDHANCTDPSHNHHHADEHTWLSLKNAIHTCEQLTLILASLDPARKEIYAQTAKKYIKLLQELDTKYTAEISTSPRNTVIVTDRFPFLYMMEDYNISYFAAFHGCSAETEASFKTIAFLSDKVNEFDIKTLLILEGGLKNLAKTIAQNSKNKDCNILELNSMQSITKEDIAKGATYYSIMSKNLDTLKQALAQ